ncbi:DUF6282 family protein [Salipiger bermudensis]|uniref:DUF6282 family protein n=1 Tax=Salipiger bermudensis TaxID=344736 RepID=UPI001CD35B6A|nr:DUF6282 family protein [Salipiger bermudensis]MCA0963066.1 DUF6282 family protein [Salipiger bermudensis]
MTDIETIKREQADRISEILTGAVDPHVHSGPSIAQRAIDHLDLVKGLSEAGFAAVVTKDHDYAGTMTAALIRAHHPDLTTQIFSSIVLNNVVGGFNAFAVEHCAATDGRIVWLPTLAAENHLQWANATGTVHPASTAKIRPAQAIPLFEDGKLRPEVLDVLDVVAATGMALASGHIHASETRIVFEEARKRGIERLIFTHPEDIVGATVEDMKAIADMGAYLEHSLAYFVEGSKFRNRTNEELREFIDHVGPERTILCSDMGQLGNMLPLEGMRGGVAICIEQGYSDEQIHKMVATNAAEVIGLTG